MEIREDLVPFLMSGVSLLVGTRDAELVPACARAMGVRIASDRRSFTVYLPAATADRTLANVRDNGRIAVTFSRVLDLRGVQMKGHVTSVREAPLADRDLQARYFDAFLAALEEVGMPRGTSQRMAFWPSVAIDVTPDVIFEQTPGPVAGRPLPEGATMDGPRP